MPPTQDHALRRTRYTGNPLLLVPSNALFRSGVYQRVNCLVRDGGVLVGSGQVSEVDVLLEATPSIIEPIQQPTPQECLSVSPPSIRSDQPIDTLGGWTLAFTVLAAAYLGRVTAHAARRDVRRLQRDRERHRALSAELRLRREAWRAAEDARLATEEARRVDEIARKAREEAHRLAEQQRIDRERAAEESRRIAVEREAAKAEYDAQAAKIEAEYRARVEAEQKRLAELRAIRAEEEERRRRILEEARLAAEEERQRLEAEERHRREEVLRLAEEERRRVEREKKRFAVSLEGTVTVEHPPVGTIVPGIVPQEAVLRVGVSTGSLLGGTPQIMSEDYASLDDARRAAPRLITNQARAACDAIISAFRLQEMVGEGPLKVMALPEAEHWMAIATARSAIAALLAFDDVTRTSRVPSKDSKRFFVRTEYGVLPVGHSHHPEAVFGETITLIEAGEGLQRISASLEPALVAGNKYFYSGTTDCVIFHSEFPLNLPWNARDSCNYLSFGLADLGPRMPECLNAAPKCLGACLELSHFLNRMLHDRPVRVSDAPVWFEAGAAFVRTQLRELLRDAPPDSLEALNDIIMASIGCDHPVATEMAALTANNLSAAERARRDERARARQALLAAKLLEEAWPTAEEIRAAQFEEKEAKTPVAERVWALRNVAGTLALGAPGELARARQLLEQAVKLKQQYADAPDHPVVLPELLALIDVLRRQPAWAPDAAGVAGLVLRVIANISAEYANDGDVLSAAALMEAGLRQFEEIAGVKSSAVHAAIRRADQLIEALSPKDREILIAARPKYHSLVLKVSDALTEQLGAYQDAVGRNRLQEWNQRGPAMIGPLL